MKIFAHSRDGRREGKRDLKNGREKGYEMKKSRFTDRTKWKIIIVLMVGMVVVALFLQAGILMYVNSKNLDKTSQMLLDQSISIIEKNQKNEIDLIRSMKEDYVIRARAVSYILESRLEAEMIRRSCRKSRR